MNPTHFAVWLRASPEMRARFRYYLLRAWQMDEEEYARVIYRLLTAIRYIEGGGTMNRKAVVIR